MTDIAGILPSWSNNMAVNRTSVVSDRNGSNRPERRFGRRRNYSIAAVVAGLTSATLLFGAGTTANWSDVVTIAGGTVTAGNLDVELAGGPVWQDVSASESVAIPSIESYRIIPGDTVRLTQDLDVALYGDNILGTFEIGLPDGGPTGDLFESEYVTATYKVIDKRTGQDFVGSTSATSPAGPYNLSKAGLTREVDGTADLAYQVEVVFDQNTPERILTQANGTLKNITASVKQVRTPLSGALEAGETTATIVGAGATTQLAEPGDTARVTYTIKNTGSLPLTGLRILAPGVTFENDGSLATLAVGAEHTFTGSYNPTNAQITGQDINVNAIITATPQGTDEELLTEATATIKTITPAPDVTPNITSKFTTDGGTTGTLDVGDVIEYTMTVPNTGNVDLVDVGVSSDKNVVWSPKQGVAKGATATFTGTLTATSADVNGQPLQVSHTLVYTSPVSTTGAPVTDGMTVSTNHSTAISTTGGMSTVAIPESNVGSNVVVNLVNGDVYRNNTMITPRTPGVKFTQVETSRYNISSVSSSVYAIDTSGVFWYAENGSTTLTRNTTITEPVSSITTGHYGNTFLLTNTGKVYATGRYNDNYDLGTGDKTAYVPNDPKMLSFGGVSIKMVSAGLYGGHAVDSLGRVWGWGGDSGERLGNGASGNTTIPALITQPVLNSGESIVQIDEGYLNTTLLTNQGRVFEFGFNAGTIDDVTKSVPTLVSVPLPGNDTPVFISRGTSYQSYVIGSSGKLHGWSNYTSDPLVPTSKDTITTMTALNNMLTPGEKFVDVTFGISHNSIGAALTSTGRLITWGDASSSPSLSPTPVVNKTGVAVPTR